MADPAWTRLLTAALVPMALAVTAPLPGWARLAIVVMLVPLMAQGWPALLTANHDRIVTGVISLTGIGCAVAVAYFKDFGVAGIAMAAGVLAAFIGQMVRRDGRPQLVEALSINVTGNLVVVCGTGWCALVGGIADPAVMVPCALSLFVGAVLTTLEVRAIVLEVLTVIMPAVVAGVAGGVLASMGFFGPLHVDLMDALQTAAASTVVGLVAGILMAVANRLLWTHRWVPGGRAAVASAVVPVLACGGPIYALARLMNSFLAG